VRRYVPSGVDSGKLRRIFCAWFHVPSSATTAILPSLLVAASCFSSSGVSALSPVQMPGSGCAALGSRPCRMLSTGLATYNHRWVANSQQLLLRTCLTDSQLDWAQCCLWGS
jgi:hypothetical protein